MKIEFNNIILRDMIKSDIEDYVRWFTVEREWENWDAPWEKEDTDEEAERKKWTEYYESVKDHSDDTLRWKFEIEWNDRHIGWVSSYCIDENYEWIGKPKDGQIAYRAIGIDICEPTIEHARYLHHTADIRHEEALPEIDGVEILFNNAGVQQGEDDIAPL